MFRKTTAPAAAAATDHTAGLSDRSLAETFLRLRSPSALARAAGVCRRWRRVASSPAFLRLFRRLHPPPLLGFFVCNDGFTVNGALVGEVLNPTFFSSSNPAPPPGLSGAVRRCAHFSLASLPGADRWALADTRDGLHLLRSRSDNRFHIPRQFVVCHPVTGRSALLPRRAQVYDDDDDGRDESAYLGAALVLSDADAGAGGRLCFEVIVVTYFVYGLRLFVFSSHSGAWTAHPYSFSDIAGGGGVPPMPGSVGYAMHADGRVYWVVDSGGHAYLLALDTHTKAFSGIKLLSSMRERYEGNMRVVRSGGGGGELRMVALADGLVLDLWRLDRSRSSRGRWVREARRELAYAQGVMGLIADAGIYRTSIMDAGEGFVFFKHFRSDRVFVLDLDAMVFTPLPHNEDCHDGLALPYRMVLQPPFPVLG
ncbi:hypothetical protein BS78_07G059500 [Paspalum vaginatum]|nr:hypothetical protein BS78_07G059500 [Paspalum vaginatum]